MAEYIHSGTEFAVNTTSARTQAHADLTRLADGRLLAVWIDGDFNTTADRFVRAQLFDADGTPLGAELSFAANGAIRPDVTGLADGGFALTWIGMASTRVHRFDADGVAVAAPVDLNPPGAYGDNQPRITALANGGYAVVWDDTHTSGGDVSGSGIRLSTFDAAGNPLLNDVLVNSLTGGNQADASVTGLANGGFVVTWTDRGPSGAWQTWMAKAQLFDASGARIGGEFHISDPASDNNAIEPAVTTLANGNFVVAWFEDRAQHVQVFTPTGAKIGAEITVPGVMVLVPAVGPAIAALADGGFALAWQDNDEQPSDGSGSAIFVQAYDAFARPAGAVLRANSQTQGDQIDPSITGMADGGFMVSWTDLNGAGADDDEVRAQIFERVAGPAAVEIVSDGGGDTAVRTVNENDAAVAQIAALASEIGAPIHYAITGGADAVLFAIDAETGALRFLTAPDHEAAADQDGDNVYDVSVTASAGEASDTQQLAVHVANIDEPLVGWEDRTFDISENENLIARVSAVDPDGVPLTYAITGGADAALFAIEADSGLLAFIGAPDYEAPASADGSNGYRVSVTASGGTLAEQRDFLVRVHDMDEPLTITSNGGGTYVETSMGEDQAVVATVQAVDPDGGFVGYRIIGGNDAALFAIDALSGVLRFVATPDYETPRDYNGDNRYEVAVEASDGNHVDQQYIRVEVTNVAEQVAFTSFNGAAEAKLVMPENQSAVATLKASEGGNGGIQYTIVGGADAGRFTVDILTGALAFVAPPNFELPADLDQDNRYEVVIGATNGQFSDTQTLLIDVGDIDEAIAFTSFGGAASAELTVQENSAFVGAVHAEDPEGGPVRYTIVGGADGARFEINPYTGEIRFDTAPDHEHPQDQGGDNRYQILVQAKDATGTSDTQLLTINVADLRDGRTITGTSASDSISPGTANSALRSTNAEDTIYGMSGNDQISGGGGEDRIDGGANNDTLIGGLDADELMGGSGADTFVFTSVLDSRAGAADHILDFVRSQGDRIHLGSIDANPFVSGDQAFAFIGSGAFTGTAGQLRYAPNAGDLWLYADLDGDRAADLEIQLEGYYPLAASDFIL